MGRQAIQLIVMLFMGIIVLGIVVAVGVWLLSTLPPIAPLTPIPPSAPPESMAFWWVWTPLVLLVVGLGFYYVLRRDRGWNLFATICAFLFLELVIYHYVPAWRFMFEGGALTHLLMYVAAIMILAMTEKTTGKTTVVVAVMMIIAFTIMGFAHVGAE